MDGKLLAGPDVSRGRSCCKAARRESTGVEDALESAGVVLELPASLVESGVKVEGEPTKPVGERTVIYFFWQSAYRFGGRVYESRTGSGP